MKLQYLGILGNIVAESECGEYGVGEVRTMLCAFYFPTHPHIHSVRVTTGEGRVVLIRRPRKGGSAPRVRVMTLQERAATEAPLMCEGCTVLRYPHTEAHHALYGAVAPRMPRQRRP